MRDLRITSRCFRQRFPCFHIPMMLGRHFLCLPSHPSQNQGIIVPHVIFHHFPRDQGISYPQISSLSTCPSPLSSPPAHFGKTVILSNKVRKGLFCSLEGNQHRVAHIYVARLTWHPKQSCIQSGHWEKLLGMDTMNIND